VFNPEDGSSRFHHDIDNHMLDCMVSERRITKRTSICSTYTNLQILNEIVYMPTVTNMATAESTEIISAKYVFGNC
jgi:hypothetical protein